MSERARPSVDSTDRILAFGLGFLGAGLATLSLFMPYVDEASVAFSRVAENTILQSEYGWINVPLVGLWVFGLVRNVMSPHRVVWPIVVGALTIASAVWAVVDEGTRTLCPIGATTITSACDVAEPGLGIYMLGISGLVLAASGIFFLRFPRRAHGAGATADDYDPMTERRECPHCRSEIRPDASVCPHCRRESDRWTLHEDRWWVKDAEGWLWLDPGGGWRRPSAESTQATSGS